MASPWFRFFPKDYLGDTKVRVLTHQEKGILLDLWCYCAQDGSVPSDPAQLARLLKVSTREVSKALSVLRPFFQEEGGALVSVRLSNEIARYDEVVEKRKQAGSKGGSKRVANAQANASTQAQAELKSCLTEPEPEPEPEKDYPLAPRGAPAPSAPVDPPRRKRRSKEEILSPYGEDVKRVVSELMPVWPGFHDPEEQKPIRFNRAAFALRVSEILAKHKNATPDLLLEAAREYLNRPGEGLWWKGPEFFFGPEGPWLGIVNDILTRKPLLQVTA